MKRVVATMQYDHTSSLFRLGIKACVLPLQSTASCVGLPIYWVVFSVFVEWLSCILNGSFIKSFYSAYSLARIRVNCPRVRFDFSLFFKDGGCELHNAIMLGADICSSYYCFIRLNYHHRI